MCLHLISAQYIINIKVQVKNKEIDMKRDHYLKLRKKQTSLYNFDAITGWMKLVYLDKK